MAMMAPQQWEILIVKHGIRHALRSESFMSYSIYGEPDDDYTTAYYFWVLRSGDQIIHVDTGYSAEGATKRGRTVLIDPLEALRHLGLSASSGHPVVVTHAHYDHIGNLAAFANSPIHISANELEFWTSDIAPKPLFAHFGDQAEVANIVTAKREGRLHQFSGRATIAPGVELVEVGGHTPGQLVVLVDTAVGKVMLASDAAHFHEELDRDMLFLSMADLPQAYRTLDWIRQQQDTIIITGHDAGELERFTPIQGPLAGLVSIIQAHS